MRWNGIARWEHWIEGCCRALSTPAKTVIAGLSIVVSTALVQAVAIESSSGIGPGAIHLMVVAGVARFLGRLPALVAAVLGVASYQFIFRTMILHASPWTLETGILFAYISGLAIALLASRTGRGPNPLGAGSKGTYEAEIAQGEAWGRSLIGEMRFTHRPYLLGLSIEKIVDAAKFGAREIGFCGALADCIVASSLGNDLSYQADAQGGVIQAGGEVAARPIGD